MKIDSHHHFWKYQTQEYGWLDESMKAIRRDFLPAQLKSEIEAAGIDGVVSVQVRQTVEETTWLLELARVNPFILGVVGWAPLVDRKVADVLEPLAGNRKLRSLRHIIQGEPDDNFILRGDFNVGITALSHFNLAYDILIYERHLPQTIRFVDLHPSQTFVLDHIAKPKIKDQEISPWRENFVELAKRANVYCKLSGMVTEADHQHWTPQDLDPYFDTALEAFGPQRLMFGSDWPVCLLATGYSAWCNLVAKKIARLSSRERARILGGTAVEAYGL